MLSRPDFFRQNAGDYTLTAQVRRRLHQWRHTAKHMCQTTTAPIMLRCRMAGLLATHPHYFKTIPIQSVMRDALHHTFAMDGDIMEYGHKIVTHTAQRAWPFLRAQLQQHHHDRLYPKAHLSSPTVQPR